MVRFIRIDHERGGGIEKPVPRITDCHHKACRVMTNGTAMDGFFYPILTRIIVDSFSSSLLIDTSFYIKNIRKTSRKSRIRRHATW